MPTTDDRSKTRYALVLRAPYVPTLLAGTLIGRLPGVMAPTLVLLAQTRAGTGLSTAGFLAALQASAGAAGQPVLARAADRLGHRRVLVISTVATALVFSLLAVLPTSEPVTGVLVALSGMLAPPLQSLMRGRWQALVPDAAIGSAHALDSSVSELLYVAAPLIAAATVYGSGPASGYVLAAALGAAGTAILSTAPSVTGRRSARAHTRLGPLRSTDLRWLMAIHATLGAAVGAVAVAGVLVATRAGQPGDSGLLPATYAIGGLVGGLLFGARQWPGTPAFRFPVGFGLMALTWVPVAACATPLTAAVAALLPGGAMIFTLITGSDLRHAHITEDHAEASGWVIAATGLGRAAGVAIASPWPAMWWPAIYAACGIPAAAWWLHHSRTTRRHTHGPDHLVAAAAAAGCGAYEAESAPCRNRPRDRLAR